MRGWEKWVRGMSLWFEVGAGWTSPRWVTSILLDAPKAGTPHVHPVVPHAAQVSTPDLPVAHRTRVLGHRRLPTRRSPSTRTRVRALPRQKEKKC